MAEGMHTRQADLTTDAIREGLGNVFWIGGGPASGKSTIARRLANRYGLHLYATDDVMGDHADRVTAEEAPCLDRFKAMDMDERWLTRSPEIMLDTFHWFHGEAFHLIVDDLLSLPTGTRVVAEGFRLLPHLVKPLLAEVDRAVWLLPTADFRDAALAQRGSTWQIPAKTSDPERARQNLSERDRLFTERLIVETDRLGVRAIRLVPGMCEDEVADQVARQFAL
ncbi:hypothetical protein ACLQ20_19805 [Micromonospora sp. DT46]|uniref:hypothetical protein n=1 Tax=Micromonospora sp. DT46 TaxID=3393435 RepID=UPI003CE7E727